MSLENKSGQFGRQMWGEGSQSSSFKKRYSLSSKSKSLDKPRSKVSKEKPKMPDKTPIPQFLSSLRKQSGEIPATGGRRYNKKEIAEISEKVKKFSAKYGGTYFFHEKNKAKILKDWEKTGWGKSKDEKLKVNREIRWLKKQWGNK